MSKYLCDACGAPTVERFDFPTNAYRICCSACGAEPRACECPRPWYDRLVDAIHELTEAIRGGR